MKSLFVFFLFSLSIYSQTDTDAIVVLTDPETLSEKLSSHYGSEKISKENLARVDHFEELIPQLPGVMNAGGTSRARFFQIRGIGERSSYEGMPNESVTILLDEIDYTGVGGVLETFGLSSFEVYKGPQNTVTGPSAFAGSFRAHSEKGETNKFKIRGNLESFNGRSLGFLKSFNKGNLKGSFSSQYRESDGYFKNRFYQKEDTNNREEFSFKSHLGWKNWEVNVHFFNFENGYDVFNLNNSKETISDDPGKDDQRTLGLSLVNSSDLGFGKLKSILSGHRTDSFYSYDEDWGNNNFWLSFPGYNSVYDYRIGFDKNLRNFNLEERFEWGSGKLIHTSGVFFKNTHLSSRELGFNKEVPRKDLKSTFKRRRIAIFHETEMPLSRGTWFLGVRGVSLKSEYRDSNNISLNPNESLFGAHFGVKKEVGTSFWSARLSRGFKAGGVNIGSNITADRREFREESLYQLDLLWKRKEPQWKFDINLFANTRRDIQVKTSFQDNPSDPSSFTFYTDNATSGTSYGMEGQFTYTPFSFYQASLSGNLMDARYGSYVYGSRNLKGREFAYAPNYKVTLSQRVSKNGYFLTLGNILTDSFFFGNSHDEVSPKTFMTNLSIGFEKKDLKISLWGRNIFNERSETRGFFFGNRPPNFSDERFVQVGPPRILGLTLSYEI